jgi:nitroimidazol reductase NimA-like FMN-containing flavoprotein (pyridoxamine 5'-phosphate oxidase superfamily)
MAVADDADSRTAAEEARRVLAANAYMTLATVDADGRPWATPVWFATRDLRDFVWVSRPGARHSRNIAAASTVGIVVFDSAVPVGGGSAVYVEAVAEEVGPDDRTDVLTAFNERAHEQGIDTWDERKVVGASQFRLYRARATKLYVLDEHDGRVEVGGSAILSGM